MPGNTSTRKRLASPVVDHHNLVQWEDNRLTKMADVYNIGNHKTGLLHLHAHEERVSGVKWQRDREQSLDLEEAHRQIAILQHLIV